MKRVLFFFKIINCVLCWLGFSVVIGVGCACSVPIGSRFFLCHWLLLSIICLIVKVESVVASSGMTSDV